MILLTSSLPFLRFFARLLDFHKNHYDSSKLPEVLHKVQLAFPFSLYQNKGKIIIATVKNL